MRYNINMAARLALVTVFAGSLLFSQVPKTVAKPSFEVASVIGITSSTDWIGAVIKLVLNSVAKNRNSENDGMLNTM